MISDLIKIGTKVDIMPDDVTGNGNEEFNSVFHSKVQDVFPNGDLEVDMPTVNGKLILLHNGVRYRVIFYTDKATYVAKAKVVERYKSNNMFLLKIRILTQLEKFQRREYFRCECTLDVKYAALTEEHIKKYDEWLAQKEQQDVEPFMVPYYDGVALDISGGGIRFNSRQPLSSDGWAQIVFYLKTESFSREFTVIGKVLSSTYMEESHRYENRIQFTHIKNDERETIIRFIFEQERKSRKLAGGR